MSKPDDSEISADFAAVFRAHASADGLMDFGRFMELALYDDRVGYYRAERARIGYAAGTDFFTASTSGPVFGELVVASCIDLLGTRSPRDFTFVEIGAESSRGILAGVTHPFGSTRTISVGDRIELSGQCVVFSNELFDAQPFRRFIFRAGAWREIAVQLVENRLQEVEISCTPPSFLPSAAPESYVIDAPLAASQLVEKIAGQAWTGLFVACDYGKSWRELVETCPNGTARAYYRHRQSNALLSRPGEQDLTCHVCWDWLCDALIHTGFSQPIVESHEAYFVKHSCSVIAEISTADAARFSQRKLSLLQLLHPSYLGQKFQVLHASRQ